MDSSRLQKAKATQTIHIKRLRTGLGFSVKGGLEHGIPIVVCEVEIKGAACVCVCVSCVSMYMCRIVAIGPSGQAFLVTWSAAKVAIVLLPQLPLLY